MRSLTVRVVVRLVRLVPGLLLAAVIGCAGMAIRDFFFQAADQIVSVESSLSGGRK